MADSSSRHEPDPLQPHRHDPNPAPPSPDASVTLRLPSGESREISVEQLRSLPATTVENCYIVSTGHGTSGPFAFSGVKLLDLIEQVAPGLDWGQVEVISGDGFGTRVQRPEIDAPEAARPIILAVAVDRSPLTRADGLVRLIVPSETDDALRQVKWVAEIRLVAL